MADILATPLYLSSLSNLDGAVAVLIAGRRAAALASGGPGRAA